MHYLAAAVMLSIYAYNLPVVIAFIWKKHRFAAGIGAFYGQSALKRAERQLGKEKPRKKTKRKRVKRAVSICIRLIHDISFEHFSARLLVGTGDAAKTAEICGGLTALGHVLRTRAREGYLDIRPDFSGRVLEGEVKVVISLRAGDMARAAFRYATDR